MPPVSNPMSVPVESIFSGTKLLMDQVGKNQAQAAVLKRKMECLTAQVELLKERGETLAKKLHGAYSFRARYDVLKQITAKKVGEEEYKKIHAKVHDQANEVHKTYTVKHEKDKQDYEAKQDELIDKCTADVAKLKKEGADRLATWAHVAEVLNNGGGGGGGALGDKGKKRASSSSAGANGEKPKRQATASAYSRFVGDKSTRARYDAEVKAGETDLAWFKWVSAAWGKCSDEEKQPYVDEAVAAKAAKANGGAPKENGHAEPPKKKAKTVAASPAAAPAGEKKKNGIAEAFARSGKGRKLPDSDDEGADTQPKDDDDDDDDDEEEFGGRGVMAKAKAKAKKREQAATAAAASSSANKFIDDEAEEAGADEDEEEGDEEMKDFIVPDGEGEDDEDEEGAGEDDEDEEEEVAPADSDNDV